MRTLLAATAAAVTALVIGTAGTASAEPANDPPGVVAVNPATARSATASGVGLLFEDHAPITAQIADRTKSDSPNGGSELSAFSQGIEASDDEPAIGTRSWRDVCAPFDAHDDYSCFQEDGDYFWVHDGRRDSASAVAVWRTDYGRAGACYNSEGYDTYVTCNYNMREGGHSVFWKTCYQDLSADGKFHCGKETSAIIG